MFFKRIQLESYVEFSCHFSLISLVFPNHHDLDTSKITGQLFCEISLLSGFTISLWLDSYYVFGTEISQTWCSILLWDAIGGHTTSICPLLILLALFKVEFSKLLHCISSLFLFVTSILWGDILRLRKHPIPCHIFNLLIHLYQCGLHGFLFYSMGYNSLLKLLSLILKLYPICPRRASSLWFLYTFGMSSSLFKHFLTLGHKNKFQIHFVLSLHQP